MLPTLLNMKGKKLVYTPTQFREFGEKFKGVLLPRDTLMNIYSHLGDKSRMVLLDALIKYVLVGDDTTFENETMACLWSELKSSQSKMIKKYLIENVKDYEQRVDEEIA